MGRDKACLPWGGEPLLSRVVGSLRPLVAEVIVVARKGQVLPSTSARLVEDRVAGAGPLAGLEAGLAAMRTPYGIVVACDMPWLNGELLKAMLAQARGCDLVIPRVSGKCQPLHAVYAKRLQPAAAGLLARGERRLQALAERVKGRVLEEPFVRAHDPTCRSVRGLDRWQAYQRAVRDERRRRGG